MKRIWRYDKITVALIGFVIAWNTYFIGAIVGCW